MREKREPCTPTSTTQRMIAINHLHRRTLERNLKETGIHRAQHRLLMNLAANPTSSLLLTLHSSFSHVRFQHISLL